MANDNRIQILTLLKEKSVLKQDVYKQTLDSFKLLKETIKEIVTELSATINKIDKRVVIDFSDKSEFAVELKVAGDVLVFYMHTNIFEFDKTHPVWKNSYVRDNEYNSYCGMIQIFNFLSDSFKYNRTNDLGYLIGRIFINRENHFYVEGKKQLGFLYNDFGKEILTKENLKKIVESAILYCLSFDLYSPPFASIKEVTLEEIQQAISSANFTTGKRLGFKFQSDKDITD